MNQNTFRDMHLLNEVTHSPDSTQRELSTRIGIALGLTNLMLRRLAKKGYIKITGTKRSRLRYLITPQGILEKSRLTCEFIQYSLHLYSRVRFFLREQLALLLETGNRRILLCGTGELAEIAFLTIHEMGLELVGVVVERIGESEQFLGQPVRSIHDTPLEDYDRVIVAWLNRNEEGLKRLIAAGVPEERIISLQHHAVFNTIPPSFQETELVTPAALIQANLTKPIVESSATTRADAQ